MRHGYAQLDHIRLHYAETPDKDHGRIRVPILFIYGEHDVAVLSETVRGVDRFVEAGYREVRIPDSGHWVQNEAIEEVNTALLDFLGDESLTTR